MLVLYISAIFLIACNLPRMAGSANSEATMGKALYEQNSASYHGIDGEGQPDWKTPGENGVYRAPPHTAEGHTWHHPDQHLLDIMANGGAMPNSTMPGFGEQLSEEEVAEILTHIKTFWGDRELEFQELVTKQYIESSDRQ